MEKKYFEDIITAINEITYLMLDENWIELAKYYDLSNSVLKYDDIANRNFFMADEKPDDALPGLYWMYKYPFPPGYRYLFTEPINNQINKIWLTNKIEVGEGIDKQGRTNFKMIYFLYGYQILPPKHLLNKNYNYYNL